MFLKKTPAVLALFVLLASLSGCAKTMDFNFQKLGESSPSVAPGSLAQALGGGKDVAARFKYDASHQISLDRIYISPDAPEEQEVDAVRRSNLTTYSRSKEALDYILLSRDGKYAPYKVDRMPADNTQMSVFFSSELAVDPIGAAIATPIGLLFGQVPTYTRQSLDQERVDAVGRAVEGQIMARLNNGGDALAQLTALAASLEQGPSFITGEVREALLDAKRNISVQGTSADDWTYSGAKTADGIPHGHGTLRRKAKVGPPVDGSGRRLGSEAQANPIAKFEGLFHDGAPVEGKITYGDGAVYEGQVDAELKRHGIGALEMEFVRRWDWVRGGNGKRMIQGYFEHGEMKEDCPDLATCELEARLSGDLKVDPALIAANNEKISIDLSANGLRPGAGSRGGGGNWLIGAAGRTQRLTVNAAVKGVSRSLEYPVRIEVQYKLTVPVSISDGFYGVNSNTVDGVSRFYVLNSAGAEVHDTVVFDITTYNEGHIGPFGARSQLRGDPELEVDVIKIMPARE